MGTLTDLHNAYEELPAGRIPGYIEGQLAFAILGEALSWWGLPTSTGADRQNVDPDEFMLMSTRGHWANFKHRATRNYIRCNLSTGKLFIPTGAAFCRGEFDE